MEVSKKKVQNTNVCLQYSTLQSGRTTAVICHILPAIIFSFCNSVLVKHSSRAMESSNSDLIREMQI